MQDEDFQSLNQPHADFSERSPQSVIIQGVNEKIRFNELTLVFFKIDDPHKIYICNLDIEFDRLPGSQFLEQSNCIVDIKNRNFNTLPLFKITDDTV